MMRRQNRERELMMLVSKIGVIGSQAKESPAAPGSWKKQGMASTLERAESIQPDQHTDFNSAIPISDFWPPEP